MKTHPRLAPAVAALIAGLPACGSSAGAGAPPPAPLVSAACADPGASVVITDPTNYTLSDAFDLQTYTVKDDTDLVFDWSNLKTDFFGKPVDPVADIDLIVVALWHLSPAQIEDALKVDDIPLSANAGIITALPEGGSTSVDLNQFTLLGQSIPTDLIPMYFDTSSPDYAYPQDQYTFMMMASTGTTPGKQARGIALFHLDPGAGATTLKLADDSTRLSYSVDLTRAAPVEVPAATPALTVDWSQMTRNMLGNPYVWSQITRAAVAHFRTATLQDLQAKFLDLQALADGWWSTTSIAGSSVDLGTLADGSGAPFPGIDDTGIWMTALFCDNCNNPAPWSITVMQPCK
jgi:hypothetical protein